MKGFQEDTGQTALYLSIKHHGIVEESKRPREGFVETQILVPRTGATITKYVKRYKAVEGFVNKIEYREAEYEGVPFNSWKVYILDDQGRLGILDLLLNSNAGGRFMKLAENVDWAKPVEFSAWHDTVDDKTAFVVRQGGEVVRQKYTAAAPGECPPPVPRGRTNKLDFTDQEDFLFDRMTNVVIPAVDQAAAARTMKAEAPSGNGNIPADDWNDQF